MTEKSDGQNEKSGGENEKSDDKDDLQQTRWPWWGQFLLAVIALSIACVLLIWLPVEMVAKARNDTGNAFTTFIAVLVGLTTMTISGMFLFMTFRIDRGARLAAREEARSVAERETWKVAKENTKKIAKKEIKAIENSMVENITEETRKREKDVFLCMGRSRGQVEEAGKKAKDRIACIGAEARVKVQKVGGEARKKIELDMENIKNEAVNRTNEQVSHLIKDARGKIAEADIEKLLDERIELLNERIESIEELLNERIESILARLADRRGGMFSFRGRNPRS